MLTISHLAGSALLSLPNTLASTAISHVTINKDVRIRTIQRVPTHTFSLTRVDSRDPLPAQGIDLAGYRLQMDGIATVRHPAKMIELQSFGDGTDEELPHPDMDVASNHLPQGIVVEHSMTGASVPTALPFPAVGIRVLDDLREQSISDL